MKKDCRVNIMDKWIQGEERCPHCDQITKEGKERTQILRTECQYWQHPEVQEIKCIFFEASLARDGCMWISAVDKRCCACEEEMTEDIKQAIIDEAFETDYARNESAYQQHRKRVLGGSKWIA